MFRNDPDDQWGKMARGLSPEPSASSDSEALLDGPVFLAVLLRCPDECPSDYREREHADGGNHYSEEGGHGGSLGSAGRQPARLGQCSGVNPEGFMSPGPPVVRPTRASGGEGVPKRDGISPARYGQP